MVRRGKETAVFQACYVLTPENRAREMRGLLAAARTLALKSGCILTLADEGRERVEGIEIEIQPAWRWLCNRE